MDPVTTSTAHSHRHPPPFHRRNFRFPFHPILHAPAPHLRPRYPLLNLRPKSEPDLTATKRDDNSPQVQATSKDNMLTYPPCSLPSGPKDKSKPPIISTRNPFNSLQYHMLEISDGCDVANSVAAFAARRQRSFCILSGSGTVADVSIRRPGHSDISVSLQGCFEILSISGSFFYAPPVPPVAAGITVYLAGGRGEVVGGCVVGELRASGKVVVMAVSFVNAVYERLPLEDEKAATNC